MNKIRSVLVTGAILFLMIQILWHINGDDISYNQLSQNYYIENGLEETSSMNLVTAIYLDYRLFDSFFEASTLLIAVTGIAFMAIKDEDLL